jgi:hypothetical protein
MKGRSWKDLLEVAGMAAIVASLVFVGMQLQLDRVIARSELTSESYQMVSSIYDKLTEPDFAKTFAKMLEQPEELSLDERIQLDSFFRRVTITYTRECYLVGRGILGECDDIIRGTAGRFFGSQYGQSWYQQNGPKGRENDELFPFPEWAESEISGFDPNHYRHMIEATNAGN